MAYGIPLQEGNATIIHRKLLALADEGTAVNIRIDNTYANRIASQSDLPLGIAKRLGQKEEIERQLGAYAQLASHPNASLEFSGSEHPPLFPMSKIDHRKILLVTNSESKSPDYGVVFGFNINAQLEPNLIDSAVYIDNPEALQWLKEYSITPHYTPSTRKEFDSMTFITRELTRRGNDLADTEILDTIQGAKESIVFCSQWLPDSDVLDRLADASAKGVYLSIFSNLRPFKDEPMYGYFRRKLFKKLSKTEKKTGNLSLYVQKDKGKLIHAKALVVDGNTENAKGITGTDSMSNRVLQNLGIRELLIKLNDPLMAGKLLQYIENHVLPEAVPYDFEQLNLRRKLFKR